jgi:PAS domain S-box-containing protein
VLDASGTLVDANEAPLVAGGLALGDVRGKKFWDCPWWTFDDAVRARVREACLRAAAGETVRYDTEVRTVGDARITIDFQIAPLRDAAGQITHLVPSAVDVSQRKEVERELRKSEARRRLASEIAQVGTFEWDLEADVVHWSPELEALYGLAPGTFGGSCDDWRSFIDPDDLPAVREGAARALQTGAYQGEWRVRRPDATVRWIEARAVVVRNDAGRPVRMVGANVDVTERHEREAALRRSEARFRRFLETDVFGVITWDLSGTIFDANDTFLRMVGFDRTDLAEGRVDWSRMTPEEHRAQDARAVEDLRRTGRHRPIQKEYVRKDGSRVWVLLGSALTEGEDGIAFVLDISAQKQAETALRESEELFRALADNIAQLAWTTDESGDIVWYNRRWFDFTGTTLEEMKGWGWTKVHHPDHVDRVVAKLRDHLSRGEPWEDTFPLRRHDGSYGWFLSRAVPLRDSSGKVVRWFGTNTDVTAQRDAEQALREADRRKDEFIAILAHELRNPLAPVRSAVEVMKKLAPEEPRLDRALAILGRQVSHMARLIDDLLDVSRVTRGKLELRTSTCDVADIARNTAEDYRASLEGAGLHLVVVADAGPQLVDGDAVRIAQMVGNLLHNAGRFTPRGGHVRVHVDRDGDSARICVSDDGVGLEPSLLTRLFEPFSQAEQDLARTSGGLGLGLSLARGLARLHGGDVVARSDGPGRGACFEIRLPLTTPR